MSTGPPRKETRGKPDSSKSLKDVGLTVWDTWKSVNEVYVPKGQTPSLWDSSILPKQLADNIEIDGRELKDKQGKPTLVQVNMNETTFDYIVNQRNIYSLAGQHAFFADATAQPINFPPEAMEIKAVWRLLTEAEAKSGNYYTSQQCDGNQNCVQIGLTALHLISKVQPNWFWATFEQVDNQQTTDAPLVTQVEVGATAVNQQMQSQLQQTVWANYLLRGTQVAYTEQSEPIILANTQIETEFQETSSCMTCHAIASVGSADNGRADMWNLAHGNLVGYIGEPPANIFEDGKYKALDYVWSLRRAQ